MIRGHQDPSQTRRNIGIHKWELAHRVTVETTLFAYATVEKDASLKGKAKVKTMKPGLEK